jgi:flagellar biogenesis protein FliO
MSAQGPGEEPVGREEVQTTKARIGGMAGWLLDWSLGRLRRRRTTQPRLTLVERIALAPKQSLVLVEAEGRRILVAISSEGGPAFYALDQKAHTTARSTVQLSPKPMPKLASPRFESSRVSW